MTSSPFGPAFDRLKEIELRCAVIDCERSPSVCVTHYGLGLGDVPMFRIAGACWRHRRAVTKEARFDTPDGWPPPERHPPNLVALLEWLSSDQDRHYRSGVSVATPASARTRLNPSEGISIPEVIAVELRHEASSGSVLVEPLASGLFRIAENPWFWEEFGFDDVVELRVRGLGVFDFVRVVERSSLARQCWFLPRELIDSKDLHAFADEVAQANGYWEQALGGGLFIALPADSDLDPQARLTEIEARLRE